MHLKSALRENTRRHLKKIKQIISGKCRDKLLASPKGITRIVYDKVVGVPNENDQPKRVAIATSKRYKFLIKKRMED